MTHHLLRLLALIALLTCFSGMAWANVNEEDSGADDFGGGMFSLEPIDPDLPEKIKQWNAECYACHTEAGLKNPPRDDLDLTQLKDLLVHASRFDDGVHTGMACKECHSEGYVEYPHAEQNQRKVEPCLECHRQRGGEITLEFKASVHYQAHGDKFTCVSCHSPHYMQVAEKIILPREIAEQDNGFCIRCHESELRYSDIVGEKKELPDLNEVHDWLPNPELHWDALRCVDCHSPLTRVSISHQILPKEDAEDNCVSCHSRDSSLSTRLYRYLIKEERLEKAGFLNSVLLTETYVVGATRNEWLDRASFILLGLTLAGVFLHGFLRFLSSRIRRRRN
jgi:predicted CXXCH cytochrome family protein